MNPGSLWLFALAACGQPAPPAPEEGAPPAPRIPALIADPTIDAVGSWRLRRVEESELQHGMELVVRDALTVQIDLAIAPDGSATLCAAYESERTPDLKAGAVERERVRTGRLGRVQPAGAPLALRFDHEAADCDFARAAPSGAVEVACAPSRLDGREVLACGSAILGPRATLPFGPEPRALLGRGPKGLVARYSARSTTIEPDPATPLDPSAWQLTW